MHILFNELYAIFYRVPHWQLFLSGKFLKFILD